jgi:hypothetical protein
MDVATAKVAKKTPALELNQNPHLCADLFSRACAKRHAGNKNEKVGENPDDGC